MDVSTCVSRSQEDGFLLYSISLQCSILKL
uniref:Uncharacterized protein n=1 Tax=Nelumbo nucifera TaxID=4432 RepID=A0A822ZGQ3_NELNU|nr:TPA_asm: hypothetical protein HUJ06_002297 [Nelumbo nucifera]